MPKPLIYGSDGSPGVRGVLLVANAIGLDFDFKEVNLMAGEHKTKEYLKKNPQHTIPTLEIDGKYIWDSHAIATYLIGRYAKSDALYPKDLLVRAQIDHRLHFDSGTLFIRLNKLMSSLIRNESGIRQEDKDSIVEAYDFMEKFLESNKYLVGNSLTVADLSCIATVSSIEAIIPIDAATYPKLAAWCKRISLLPYYDKANGLGLAKMKCFIDEKLTEISKNV